MSKRKPGKKKESKKKPKKLKLEEASASAEAEEPDEDVSPSPDDCPPEETPEEDEEDEEEEEEPGLLDADGTFKDEELEENYQKYVTKKEALKVEPRDRLGWKDACESWKSGPVGRGNDFNAKAIKEGWYDYHEIHLENGKRLDSYVPDEEIVSRKATDFDKVSEETFRKYCKEMHKKYSEGVEIRSNKYPDLDGQKLSGSLVLEVPKSNKESAKRRKFEKIAKQEDIDVLRYRSEGEEG